MVRLPTNVSNQLWVRDRNMQSMSFYYYYQTDLRSVDRLKLILMLMHGMMHLKFLLNHIKSNVCSLYCLLKKKLYTIFQDSFEKSKKNISDKKRQGETFPCVWFGKGRGNILKKYCRVVIFLSAQCYFFPEHHFFKY